MPSDAYAHPVVEADVVVDDAPADAGPGEHPPTVDGGHLRLVRSHLEDEVADRHPVPPGTDQAGRDRLLDQRAGGSDPIVTVLRA